MRNLTLLKWYEDPKAGTNHSPAKIRDKWNEEYERQFIGVGANGIDTVKKGIEAAREYLEANQLGIDEAIEERRSRDGGNS